jgi:hypothetical protein
MVHTLKEAAMISRLDTKRLRRISEQLRQSRCGSRRLGWLGRSKVSGTGEG